jgi:hypothetical protein
MSLAQMEALQDAIRIITNARFSVANGSMTVWRILNNAGKHLDKHFEAAQLRGE